LDRYRLAEDGSVQVSSAVETLSPMPLYRLDHGEPAFMKRAR